ncbi:hypothetical protein BGZ94_009652, partial [Podila epigama]
MVLVKSLTPILLLAGVALLESCANGQAVPTSVPGAAFAKSISQRKFFILGGQDKNQNGLGQFFSLDLAVPWTSSQPVWQQLADGPMQFIFPAVFSPDGKTMITFRSGGTTFAYKYSVDSNAWKPSAVTAQHAGFQGVGAVADPNTGLVYMPGSYTDGSRNSMNIYNFDSDTMVQVALPEAAFYLPNRSYYSGTWSQKRMSALFFGGYNASLQQIPGGYNAVTEYVPASATWSKL